MKAIEGVGSEVCDCEFVHGLMFTNKAFPSPWGVTLLVRGASITTGQAGDPLACPRRLKAFDWSLRSDCPERWSLMLFFSELCSKVRGLCWNSTSS